MKLIIVYLILSLCPAETAFAQKRKRTNRRASRAAASSRKPPLAATALAGRMAGSPVVITTLTGGQITGDLVSLDASTIKLRSKGFESVIGLETVGSIGFRPATAGTAGSPASGDPSRHGSFTRDSEVMTVALEAMASTTRSGIDYAEYGRHLSELRRTAEGYVSRYSDSENGSELRSAAVVAGALIDYSWAKTVWTLKLGTSSSGVVAESESPAVADVLAAYPDMRNAAADGARLSIDKLIAGLWNHAADKAQLLRSIIEGSSGR